MSFVITLYVREGIVMASDSRLSLNKTVNKKDSLIHQISVSQSDSNYKTFLTKHRFGISTFGAADINGVPITGYIESFIDEKLGDETIEIDQVPQLIKEYFRDFDTTPSTGFHIAGYKTKDGKKEQQVWHAHITKDEVKRLNPENNQGISWAGEGDIIARLIHNVGIIDSKGKIKQLPYHPIPWGIFTLQDAIDYAIYAVRTTIETIRFQPRANTVGGPIDVLVLKPNEAFWVKRKELHG